MQTSNFGFGNTTVTFCLVWPRMGCFCPCWALHQDIFWVRVRFNNFIVTYLRRLSTLVLEAQPYLIILIWPHLGYFQPFLCLSWLFLDWIWGSKRFLKPVYVDYQFWIWNYSPICFFSFGRFWGLFGSFWALWGYFWGWGQVQILFWDLLTQPNNFCFGSMWFLQLFHTFLGGWIS